MNEAGSARIHHPSLSSRLFILRPSISSFLLLALLLSGCAHATRTAPVALQGPDSPAPLQIKPWNFSGQPGRCLVSPHYLIYTTVEDRRLQADIGQLMEGALAEYSRLGAGVPLTNRPLVCYVFANRTQWAWFTQNNAGNDAKIYLQINRGGYTIGDRYVAYFLGDPGTFSVAAHEGFHQFIARHMLKRIPPFLEEGLACMFEDVQWNQQGLPRWDLAMNIGRQAALCKALEHNQLFALENLVAMHAGQVVNQPAERVAAFYAECWAFAEFLWEGEEGRYRPALQRMLGGAAAGTLWGDGFNRTGKEILWNPRSAGPLLEHYLGQDLSAIDRAFQRYIVQRCGHGDHPFE